MYSICLNMENSHMIYLVAKKEAALLKYKIN